jgi:hypothetical protein
LNELSAGAAAGVRRRAAQGSAEIRQRAAIFLRMFESLEITQEQIRTVRALDVLVEMNTLEARRLVENLARGAPDTWQTEAAREALAQMKLIGTRGR